MSLVPPVPSNLTSTMTNTTTTNAVNTANATHVVIVKSGGSPLTGILIGLAIAFIVLLIAVIAVRRLQRYTVLPPNKELERAVKSRADAIGVIMSLSENRIKFVPMYRAGSVFVYEERGARKVFVPTLNRAFPMSKKPAYFGIEYDRYAIEENPEALAAYGIARVVLPEDVARILDEPYDEKKGFRSLLSALSQIEAKITGKIRSIEGVAFEVYPVKTIASMIEKLAAMNRAALHAQVGVWESIEKSGKIVAGKGGLLSSPETGKNVFWILIGLAVLMMLLFVMRGISFMH